MTLLLVALQAITIPVSPGQGLCVDQEGVWYVGRAEEGIERFRLQRDSLHSEGKWPGKFSRELDIFSVPNGVIVVDYDNNKVTRLSRTGEVQWSAKAEGANLSTVDESGNVTICRAGGELYQKTSDSTEFEPLLDKYGAERSMEELIDVACTPKGLCYVDGKGNILRNDLRLAVVPGAQRILYDGYALIALRLKNAVVTLERIGADKQPHTFWKSPSGLGDVTHFSKAGKGKLLLAGVRDSGNFALLISSGPAK